MSDRAPGSPGQRAWRFYVDDMIGFAKNVLAYTEGFDHQLLNKASCITTQQCATWN
jgi:uncharacterized protein with HEPN domain